MVKKGLFFFIILGSLSFFNLIFFSVSIYTGIELLTGIFISLLLILNLIYGKNIETSAPKITVFKLEIGFIILSIILSSFAASYFHNQSFSITSYAQRGVYFILFYYLLHNFRFTNEFVIRGIFIIAFIYIAFYLLQTFAYPTQITHTRASYDRGTIRIFIPGAGYLILAFFISLNRFLKTNSFKYLLFIALAAIIFVLLGTRQVLASVGLMAALMIIFSKRIKSKFIVAFLILIAIIPIYFIFQNIFTSMIEVSEKQGSSFSDDVRVRAATYYLKDFNKDRVSLLTGNGMAASTSAYNLKVMKISLTKGFYLSDIGIIGDFIRYGFFYAMAIILIIIKVLFIKLPEDLNFIKYFFGMMLFTLPTGKTSDADNLVLISLILYMIDYYYMNKEEYLEVKSD